MTTPRKKKKKVRATANAVMFEIGDEKAVQVKGTARTVAADSLLANDYNYNTVSPHMFETLKKNIRKVGFIDPVTVRSGNEKGRFKDGHYEIIDGEHRWKAALELELVEIPVMDIGNVSDAHAKLLTVNMNEIGGKPDAERLAEIVAGFHEENLDELMELLPYSSEETDAMIDAGASDLDALESLRDLDGDDIPDSDGDDIDDDDDDEVVDVAQILGLYDLDDSKHEEFAERLQEEVFPHIKNHKKPGVVLGRMIDAFVESLS